MSAGVLFPQTGEWYLKKKIKEIRFVGLVNVSKSELDGVVSSFIGQTFTDTLFWDLQSRLYALDYFEQFTPNALPGDESNQSVIIEFSVIERPIVDSIVITGNASIRKVDILDVILLKPDDIVTKTKVRLDSEAIKNLYIERGYPDIQVQGTITRNEENNTATVEFAITEGNQTKVRTIAFVGNSYVSASTLKGLMSLKEQSFFSSGIFSETKLQEDLDLIHTYYTDRGYVDAKVVNVERSVEQDPRDGRNYLIITITIEEGNQYTFGGISFEGNELYSDEELGKLVRLSEGSILNLTRLQADYARVAGIYYDDGYIFNTITMTEKRDEINRSISFVMHITEKGKAHIENIIITGNTKTLEYVILRELPFTEGDVFSATKIREGIYNLQNLQFFSNITLDYPQGSSEGLMDLIINVEEGKTLDLNFGVTFTGTAGEFPVTGFVKVADTNFLGRGQELAATTEISGDSQELSFSFLENWLFGKRWSGGVTLSFEHDTVSEVAQDILAPIFYYDFPDPYDGHYVFSDDEEYEGTSYEAGDAFPGIPTEEQIDKYDLLTDYDYADNEIPDTYLMTYETWEMSLGLSTGYKFYTPVGRFGVGTGAETSLKKVIYNEAFYGPSIPPRARI
jgi:outer membrane protein insertion porin family